MYILIFYKKTDFGIGWLRVGNIETIKNKHIMINYI